MKISLTADDGSIPPGGSAYLLRAYIYDNEEAADVATETDPGTYIMNYPADASVVQMDAENAHNYSHELKNLSIEYAGKWIVFYTRISSGGGNISSEWAKSDAYRLPYVKLESPQVTSDQEEYEFKAKVTETPDVPGEEKTWTARRTALTWSSIKCADIFTLDLNGMIMDGTDKNELSKNFRIRQTKDGITAEAYRLVDVEKLVNGKKVTSKEWQWQKIEENALDYPEGTPETEIHHRHVSHLYGLYPGNLITEKTPELLEACRVALERRGDEGTGWCMAWKVCLSGPDSGTGNMHWGF